MNFFDFEKCFNRALSHSFSRKKFLITFPVLVLCGILIVFCKTIAIDASDWVSTSLVFLPILLSSGILLSLGVYLNRIYYHEVKQLKISFRKIFSSSWDLFVGTSYLSVPPILVYFLLWILLGFFLLLHEIPGIGPFIGVILSFGPFLLILSSLLLCMFNLFLLFYAVPAIGMKTMQKIKLAKKLLSRVKKNIFLNLVLFLTALLPIVFFTMILGFAAYLTNEGYLNSSHTLSLGFQWFFIMLPFTALLTPAVIFFFNFALESYNLHQEKS